MFVCVIQSEGEGQAREIREDRRECRKHAKGIEKLLDRGQVDGIHQTAQSPDSVGIARIRRSRGEGGRTKWGGDTGVSHSPTSPRYAGLR